MSMTGDEWKCGLSMSKKNKKNCVDEHRWEWDAFISFKPPFCDTPVEAEYKNLFTCIFIDRVRLFTSNGVQKLVSLFRKDCREEHIDDSCEPGPTVETNTALFAKLMRILTSSLLDHFKDDGLSSDGLKQRVLTYDRWYVIDDDVHLNGSVRQLCTTSQYWKDFSLFIIVSNGRVSLERYRHL